MVCLNRGTPLIKHRAKPRPTQISTRKKKHKRANNTCRPMIAQVSPTALFWFSYPSSHDIPSPAHYPSCPLPQLRPSSPCSLDEVLDSFPNAGHGGVKAQDAPLHGRDHDLRRQPVYKILRGCEVFWAKATASHPRCRLHAPT